jgi:iron-sulfur cluster assembly protein
LVLVLTNDAATIIRAIVDQSEVPDDGGLRIAAREVEGDEATLELSVAEEPDTLDKVIEQEGAHVFLEPLAAEALSDKVLDASVDDGGVRFTLSPQPGGPLIGENGNGPDA